MRIGKRVEINFSNRFIYTVVALAVLVLIALGVNAYGTSNPPVMGHSFEELEGVQARVTGTCANGSSIRVINADGTVSCEIDDVGGLSPSGQWVAVSLAQAQNSLNHPGIVCSQIGLSLCADANGHKCSDSTGSPVGKTADFYYFPDYWRCYNDEPFPRVTYVYCCPT